MDQFSKEVFLAVRVPDALRHAIRQRALDQRTSVAKIVNRLLEAELAKGSASAAVADRNNRRAGLREQDRLWSS